MKAVIESTESVVTMEDHEGKKYTARVWEGVTDKGVEFVAYIPTLQVAREADNSQFEQELTPHKPPSKATQRAIDMRFVI